MNSTGLITVRLLSAITGSERVTYSKVIGEITQYRQVGVVVTFTLGLHAANRQAKAPMIYIFLIVFILSSF